MGFTDLSKSGGSMEPQAPTVLFRCSYSLKRLEKIFVNDLKQNLECRGDFYLIENTRKNMFSTNSYLKAIIWNVSFLMPKLLCRITKTSGLGLLGFLFTQ